MADKTFTEFRTETFEPTSSFVMLGDFEATKRERKYIETIKARIRCLERRIAAPETPSTVDYIAEKKALEWLLEKAGIEL